MKLTSSNRVSSVVVSSPTRIFDRRTLHNMADDDRNRNRRKSDKLPDWHETCIGIWSRSTKGQPVDEDVNDKICNGITVVRIYGRDTDHTNLQHSNKLSKVRGLQIVMIIDPERRRPPPKAHDHTYISVDKVEADNKVQKSNNSDTDPAKEEMTSLRRVKDIMMMKKTNIEKSVEHYKNKGIKLTDVWDGVYNTCSKYYESTARIISYCHPLEKVNQMYGFVADRIKNAGKWTNDDDSRRKK